MVLNLFDGNDCGSIFLNVDICYTVRLCFFNLCSAPEQHESFHNTFCSHLKLSSYFFRSSRPGIFCEKFVLKSLAKFTGKHLCWSLFLIKLKAKKRSQHSCFPVNFAKFLRTSFFTEQPRWLLPFFPLYHIIATIYMLIFSRLAISAHISGPIQYGPMHPFYKGDELSSECAQLVGMLWRQIFGGEFEAIKFRCPRRWMSSPRREQSLN